MKRLLSTFGALSATLAVVISLTVAAPAQAASAAGNYANAAEEATNVARVKHDRVKLKGNACLRRAAATHARAMAKKRDIWHQDLHTVLDTCGLTMVGENVAAGYRSGKSVVNRGWMKSPGHRENILRKQFRLGVVAAVKGSDGRWYAAQLFGRR